MLEITIPETELYDSKSNEFINIKEQKFRIEHSLVSISKWESKWHKPFLSKQEKTHEEIVDYIRCMVITQNFDTSLIEYLPSEAIQKIINYMEDSMTGTTFNKTPNSGRNSEIFSSELIYYYMFSYGIPMECQKWHINRLFTLIKVFSIKNQPSKKMSRSEVLAQNRALNAARRKK